jgi:hypothetical protein
MSDSQGRTLLLQIRNADLSEQVQTRGTIFNRLGRANWIRVGRRPQFSANVMPSKLRKESRIPKSELQSGYIDQSAVPMNRYLRGL